MLLQIIIFFSSVILYFIAPKEYSLAFCTVNTMLFFIASVSLLMKMKDNSGVILFNIFFLFSYFLTAFAYPTYIHSFNKYYFVYPFNDIYINRGTSLALVGISAYFVGCLMHYNRKKNNNLVFDISVNYYFRQSTGFLQMISIIVVVFFYFNLERDGSLGLLSFYKALMISIGSLLLFRFSYSTKSPFRELFFTNMIFIISSLAYAIFVLSIGDRGPAMFIILIISSLYLLQLKAKRMILIIIPSIIIGVFSLFIIQQIRGENTVLSYSDVMYSRDRVSSEQESIWNYGSDLTNSSRNIYLGCEYVDKSGYQYGRQYLLSAMSVFPALVTFLEIEVKSTATAITDFHRQQYVSNSLSGMGSQLSVDIYMDFGIIGVAIVMLIFGIYASYCFVNWKNNIYALVGLLFLISTAVYLPRSSLLLEIRSLVWALLIVYINSKITSKPKYRFLIQ